MEKLENEINKLKYWEKEYYDGNPLVTDEQYDSERDKILERIKKEDPNNKYLLSVGAISSNNWPKFKHLEVMGSLFKLKTQEDFTKWCKGKEDNFLLAEKADGWSLAAYYTNGKLTNLVTRGSGVEGDDITSNAKYLKNLKETLPNKFTGILRGEAIIELSDFKEHFLPLGFSNPRNATGKLRDFDNHELKKHITIKWFDIKCDQQFETWFERLKFIKSLGLETITFYGNLTGDQVWGMYDVYNNGKRNSLNHLIDGLVCHINNIKLYDSFGIVDNRPKASIAIKFPNVGEETQLISVEFHRGSSGRVAPIGIVKPVEIDGSTVTRVSLHNEDWINAMNLKVLDIVCVAKAGDIIPQIQSVVSTSNTSSIIIFPTNCPDCLAKLVKNGAYLECQNQDCIGELVGAITKWVEKNDIKGIGDSIIENLSKNITDISDLYTKGPQIFIDAAKGSTKVGEKIHKAVQKTKTLKLSTFLSGLNIDSLGETNSEKLAQSFNTIDEILDAKEEQFRMPGISENASKIFSGLQQKKKLILKLKGILTLENKKVETTKGKLTGSVFCITGTLSKPRKEIEAWITEQGGSLSDSVNKNLTFLVTNEPDSGSSKNAKADKLGIKKISEDALYQL